VAALTWAAQYLPSWREDQAAAPPSHRPLVRITRLAPGWDPEDPAYEAEVERGIEGHCDFRIENLREVPVDLGLLEKSCGCARLDCCPLTPPEVAALKRDSHHAEVPVPPRDRWVPVPAVAVGDGPVPSFPMMPARSVALLRLTWKTPMQAEPKLRLGATVILRCLGKGERDRDRRTLEVPATLVPPVRLWPPSQRLGEIPAGGKVTKSFWYWSSTRDKLTLAPAGKLAPCLGWQAHPLTRSECAALAAKLSKEGQKTQVQSACRVEVTVYDQHEGKRLDLSALHWPVAVTARVDAEEVDAPRLLLLDWSRGNARPQGR
jgi:hypothetical protein